MYLTVSSYHVKYAFQSESTLYSYQNDNELFYQKRCDIGSLNDCNGTRTRNNLISKQSLDHLAKLAKRLSIELCSEYLSVSISLFFAI